MKEPEIEEMKTLRNLHFINMRKKFFFLLLNIFIISSRILMNKFLGLRWKFIIILELD